MKTIRPLALAVPLIAAGLGTSGNANATAYAISYNGTVNGTVDVWQQLPGAAAGTGCSLINSGINSVADCSVGTFVDNFSINPQNVSGATATLTGDPGAVTSVGPQSGPVDTLMAATGTAVGTGENNYSPLGITGTNYSRGDSVLTSEQTGTLNTATGQPFSATTASPGITINSLIEGQNIAEGEIVTDLAQATAQGNISSGTLTTITTTLTTPGQIAFDFDFDPFVEATLAPDAASPGSVARGILAVSFSITPQGGTIPAFAWAPDGSGANILNGTVLADPDSLNLTIEQQALGTTTYDPTGDGIGGNVLNYQAVTNTLQPGEYTLTLAMSERVELTKTTAVPEPATIALIGFGLAGISFASRRRRQKA